jgi:hypothetical protein
MLKLDNFPQAQKMWDKLILEGLPQCASAHILCTAKSGVQGSMLNIMVNGHALPDCRTDLKEQYDT